MCRKCIFKISYMVQEKMGEEKDMVAVTFSILHIHLCQVKNKISVRIK